MSPKLLPFLAVTACGGPPTPCAQPIGNVAPAEPVGVASTVTGTISNEETGEPLVGATVVLDRLVKSDAPELAVLVGTTGTYVFPTVYPGRYNFTVYYADIMLYRPVEVSGPTVIDQHILFRDWTGTFSCTGVAFATCTKI